MMAWVSEGAKPNVLMIRLQYTFLVLEVEGYREYKLKGVRWSSLMHIEVVAETIFCVQIIRIS